MLRARPHFLLSLSPSLFLSPCFSFFISLSIDRKREREGERERGREGERERGRERERKRERMTGAIAPFSYLVLNKDSAVWLDGNRTPPSSFIGPAFSRK
jgi:hypothetical protein